MRQGMREHRRELLIGVFGEARRVQNDPELFAAYRLLAEDMGGTRPPKDKNGVCRVLLKEAYETPKMANWAWKAIEPFWEDSTFNAEEVAPWIRKFGINRAAVEAGLVVAPEKGEKPIPAGKPRPTRPDSAGRPAAGKPALTRAEVVAPMPTAASLPTSAIPAGKPSLARKAIPAAVVRGIGESKREGAGVQEVNGDNEQHIRFVLNGDVDVRGGDIIEVRVTRVDDRGDRQVGNGTWRLLE